MAMDDFLKDASGDWESMNSGWVCTATGGLQHMQATSCCCAVSNGKDVVATRGRNRSMAELLFGVMERLKGDSEGGACVLPEHEGADPGEHLEALQLAPVLTVLCQYAAPEVAAFLEDLTPEAGMDPERLAVLMTNINPRVGITLPDCLDMEGCHSEIPHTTFLLDGTGEDSREDAVNPLEDTSAEVLPKPHDGENNEEVMESEDKDEEEVKFLEEIKISKSTNTEGEEIASGVKSVKKRKGNQWGKQKG